jgi:hypothetical protein
MVWSASTSGVIVIVGRGIDVVDPLQCLPGATHLAGHDRGAQLVLGGLGSVVEILQKAIAILCALFWQNRLGADREARLKPQLRIFHFPVRGTSRGPGCRDRLAALLHVLRLHVKHDVRHRRDDDHPAQQRAEQVRAGVLWRIQRSVGKLRHGSHTFPTKNGLRQRAEARA